jgi:hypothetical protein
MNIRQDIVLVDVALRRGYVYFTLTKTSKTRPLFSYLVETVQVDNNGDRSSTFFHYQNGDLGTFVLFV